MHVHKPYLFALCCMGEAHRPYLFALCYMGKAHRTVLCHQPPMRLQACKRTPIDFPLKGCHECHSFRLCHACCMQQQTQTLSKFANTHTESHPGPDKIERLRVRKQAVQQLHFQFDCAPWRTIIRIQPTSRCPLSCQMCIHPWDFNQCSSQIQTLLGTYKETCMGLQHCRLAMH